MATPSKRLLMEISDITECPICKETLTEPKGLPCYHTFCLKCLVRYVERNDNPGDKVACPLCRVRFVIPIGGVASLPNNFVVNNLLLANQPPDTSVAELGQKCDLCKEATLDASATAYCIECAQHLCEECCVRHNVPKATKAHQVVNVRDKPRPDPLMDMTKSFCAQHPDEQVKFYCYDCKMVACVACQVAEHSKHACSDVGESVKNFRKQLDDDIEKVTRCAQQSRDKLRQLERDNKGFMENLEAIRQSISVAHDKLKSLLDSQLKQLMEDLNAVKTERLKEINCTKDELERQCMVLESFQQNCKETKKKGTAYDILRAANDLHARSTELVKAQEQYNSQQLDPVEITFTPSPTGLSYVSNVIGNLECKSNSSTAKKFITKSKVLRAMKCAGSVCGIAQLGTELFVCTHRSERVAVYGLNTYSETGHLTVPGMIQPWSPAACKKHNCLYISDIELACIHRMDLSDSSCSKWSLNDEPYSVSLTKAFNLLVTLPQSIEEYTTNGNLIRSIKLDDLLDNPRHCVEMSSGQFVVSHWGSLQHGVCVLDTTGRIVHSYGGPPGSSTGQLSTPHSLAVDARDYVFVADFNNNRVQVLSPTLTRLGDVITPGHQLRAPWTLHFDEINCRLYVVSGGGILVLAV